MKTRLLATKLCDGGHVLVNGSPAKPSTKVRAGDRVEAFIADALIVASLAVYALALCIQLSVAVISSCTLVSAAQE